MRKFPRTVCAVLATLIASAAPWNAQAWDKWDAFKASNVNESFRVVDHSDKRKITTSEGQSYAMFFALVAGDKTSFENLLKWTEDNLAGGDLTKRKPAWLWGKNGSAWNIIDGNNAADSDMWIAYSLLEAGRLWNRPDYTEKAKAMIELLKKDVRDVKGLGKVLLPGYKGFERDAFVTLNPSYYPIFIMRRFAQEDADWNAVIEGTVRALVRSSPRGYAPDWVRFDRQGKVVPEKGDDYVLGSYNAIRTYMWAAMLSPADPVHDVLTEQFEPFAKMTRETQMPPEKVNVLTGERFGTGSTGFAACVLELLGPGATQSYLRNVIENDPIVGENYYRNTLLLFAIGFDRGLFRFDRNGYLILEDKAALTAVPPKAAESTEQQSLPQSETIDSEAAQNSEDKQDAMPQDETESEKSVEQPKQTKSEAVRESKSLTTAQSPAPTQNQSQPASKSESKENTKTADASGSADALKPAAPAAAQHETTQGTTK